MKKERLAIVGAVVAALVASLCCIGPLLFIVLGVGAFGAATASEAARPYLLGAAVLLLAFGFYRTSFRREEACAPGEACATKPAGRAGRAGLWIASVAVVAFALSPFYIGRIAAGIVRSQPPVTPKSAAVAPLPEGSAPQAALEWATVGVEGMDCTSCEIPIKAALEKTPGVVAADVSYRRGNAQIKYDPKQTDTNQIKRAIESTGYKVK